MKEQSEIRGGYEYEYDDEVLLRYMKTSTEWKLQWLEEANRITREALTAREKEIRNLIRKGEL